MDVGKRIIELREAMGMTTNKLAVSIGMSQSALRSIEIGEKSPTVLTMEKICNGLGITLAEFFGIEKKTTADSDGHNEIRDFLLSNPNHTQYLIDTYLPGVRQIALDIFGSNANTVKIIDNLNLLTYEEKIEFLMENIEDYDPITKRATPKKVSPYVDDLFAMIKKMPANDRRELLLRIIDSFNNK